MQGLAAAAGWVACAASLAGFLGPVAWFLDLCSHFRVQYFLGLLVACALMLAGRRRRVALAFGVVALANLAAIVSVIVIHDPAASGARPALRAMLMNVNTRHGDPARVAAAIRRYAPDVLVLEEVDDAWLAALSPALAAYAHSVAEPRDDNFGIALYSRIALADAEVVRVGDPDIPSIRAHIGGGSGFAILASHPLPPAGPTGTRRRDRQLECLGRLARSEAQPVMVLGDLNASPWSAGYRKLTKDNGLRDASRWPRPTWPVSNLLLGTPIDHCLHTPGIVIVRERVGPDVGSDHFPLIVDFVVTCDSSGAADR